jgi:hypothetical protein
MATTTLTIGNELLSTTMYVLMKEWRDGLHTSVGFLDAQTRIHGEGGPTQAGGTRIIQPLGFGDHSRTTALLTGYERIDLSVTDVFVPAAFEWAYAVKPVAISAVEEFVNQGEAAILQVLESRTMQVAAAMKREFVQQIVHGGIAGWERWNTLNGVDNTAPTANNAFLEENAFGAQANVVGGVSKATYSNIVGWQNQVFNGANNFNANGLAGLYDLGVEARAVSPSGAFDVWLASRAGFKNLKRSLQAQERYVDKVGDGGRLVEFWDGVRIDVEFYMPDDGTVTMTTPVSFYGLNMRDLYCIWDPKGYFELGDFSTVSGEYEVRAAKMMCTGQLITKHLGGQGLAHSLDTF